MGRHKVSINQTIFAILLGCAINIALADKDSGKHLFILSGQSNMEGMHHEEDFIPYVNQAFGAENVIVVWDAKGGEPISRWYKKWKSLRGDHPAVTGDLYDRLMHKVDKAIQGLRIRTVTFIWMQGETDARDGHGDVYQASLLGLIQQFIHDMKRDDVNVVIGRISDFDMDNSNFPHWTRVRDAQMRAVDAYSRSAWVDTDDLNDGLSRKGEQEKNALHYSRLGYELLGRRLAEKSIELIQQWSTP